MHRKHHSSTGRKGTPGCSLLPCCCGHSPRGKPHAAAPSEALGCWSGSPSPSPPPCWMEVLRSGRAELELPLGLLLVCPSLAGELGRLPLYQSEPAVPDLSLCMTTAKFSGRCTREFWSVLHAAGPRTPQHRFPTSRPDPPPATCMLRNWSLPSCTEGLPA